MSARVMTAVVVAMSSIASAAGASPLSEADRGVPAAPRPTAIDFGNDDPGGALGDEHTGPPPDIQHPSLLKDKYRGVPDPASEAAIEDPLAAGSGSPRSRAVWLGVRLGAGMFDDGAAAARPGVALGLAGRYRITDPMFLAGRADWSRRGGEVMTASVDVLGVSAGAGMTIARSAGSGLALALLAQLRGDLRLAEQRRGAPVRRAGLGIAVGAELALPATPFTLGVRYEQGLTELVVGARDLAVLAEVGIDLR